jgi:NAD(P)-dependent dehydrogenase (short-subunit alcohol dehydrogenase family)
MDITKYFSKDLFKGTVVFVTGGGSGINLGIAKNFAAVGADIAICGRTPEKLEAAAVELRALGVRVCTAVADVRKPEQLEAALAQTRAELGPVGVLVCGAAGNFPCAAEALSYNGFKSVIDIDLLGSFNACRAAAAQLIETKGTVLFISAGQAFIPYELQCHVGAAKAGIDNMMRNLALEWGKYGVRCNSIAPGPIKDTEGARRLAPGETAAKVAPVIPLGRFGTVDEIGQLAVFLASPLASYITGTLVVCDGGQNLAGSGIFMKALMDAMSE